MELQMELGSDEFRQLESVAKFLESQVHRLEQCTKPEGSAAAAAKHVQILKIDGNDSQSDGGSENDIAPLAMMLHTLTERLATAIGRVELELVLPAEASFRRRPSDDEGAPASAAKKPLVVDVAAATAPAQAPEHVALEVAIAAVLTPGGGGPRSIEELRQMELQMEGVNRTGSATSTGAPDPTDAAVAAVAAAAAALAEVDDGDEEEEQNEEDWIATLRPFTPLVGSRAFGRPFTPTSPGGIANGMHAGVHFPVSKRQPPAPPAKAPCCGSAGGARCTARCAACCDD